MVEAARRCAALWRSQRGSTPLLAPARSAEGAAGAGVGLRPGPRLFVERVGSNFVELSWVPLGGVGEEAAGFELEARGPREEHFGRFAASGGGGARSHVLPRLRADQLH